MNKLIVSITAALAFCSFDPSGTLDRGAQVSNGCVCSFLTVPSSSDSGDETIEKDDIEYGFKLYDIIKKLFE